MYELVIGWCASGAILLALHLIFAPKDTPLYIRYVLGVLALLAGAWVMEWAGERAATASDLAIISTSGMLVFLGYKLRERYTQDITAAKEIGHIDGRIEEANRQAGSARHRNN